MEEDSLAANPTDNFPVSNFDGEDSLPDAPQNESDNNVKKKEKEEREKRLKEKRQKAIEEIKKAREAKQKEADREWYRQQQGRRHYITLVGESSLAADPVDPHDDFPTGHE